MKNLFEDPDEFLKDVQEVLSVLQTKGVESSEPLVLKFKEKYAKEAKMTRGKECSGCASCAGCAICGPTLIEAIQVGHGLQLMHAY
ncbi:MAG: hypothetical protein PHS30_02405 [Bacteroidales bacterium]|nr:hypothetical protein [Bacteroidales bacterium]